MIHLIFFLIELFVGILNFLQNECSRESDDLNLNVDVLGKSLDGNAAASRLVGEPLLILGVELLYTN